LGGALDVGGATGGDDADGDVHHGEAAQVDPMKSMLKALGTERLKPDFDELLSFTFVRLTFQV
jgi:hypothetical protein